MAMLLGKKVGMTRVYDGTGRLIPVTVLLAGPCTITQVKTIDTDGYTAVQMGFDSVKAARLKNPEIGHFAKAKTDPKVFVKEMRLPKGAATEMKPGDSVTVAVFAETKFVDVISTSKGKGFAGPMKRWHFKGFPASHGTERKHRAPGSQASLCSNAGTGAGIKRGKRMGGQMGNERVTSKNHPIISLDQDKNLLVVKGTIPGPSGVYCVIRTAKRPQ
jgi:large subunit ribosomal protein L3